MRPPGAGPEREPQEPVAEPEDQGRWARASAAGAAAPAGRRWFGPGRAISLPVGYVLIGASALVFVVCVAYVAGVKRGEWLEQARASHRESGALMRTGQLESPAVRDPLLEPAPVPPAAERAAAPGSPALVGPILSDPRTPGLHYFVLAMTRLEGATRLAEFARQHGLEAYVIGSNNDRLRRVIVLPGFETSVRTHPAVQHMEQRIHQVGRLWKEKQGESDLRDAYMSLYEGV
jgi:hypothetical protein